MKYLYPAAAFVFFIFFVSCDNDSDSKEQLAAPSISPLTTNPALPANDSSAAFKAGVTLNPQHGEPGHRCDIAVGAPLNAPATSIQPNVSATPPPTSTATTNTTIDVQKVLPQASTSGTALNPKHGEPGHRCDIAVGAPLNSKPTQ